METIGGPAALGGILLCVALCGWALGRWQGGLLPGAAPRFGGVGRGAAGVGIIPTMEERAAPEAEDVTVLLGALHEEIIAYRRAQQVLGGLAVDGTVLGVPQTSLHGSMRTEPKAASQGPELVGLPDGVLQPSPAPSEGLMRV